MDLNTRTYINMLIHSITSLWKFDMQMLKGLFQAQKRPSLKTIALTHQSYKKDLQAINFFFGKTRSN